jgi:DNA-binding MarR family transcriptional regulator
VPESGAGRGPWVPAQRPDATDARAGARRPPAPGAPGLPTADAERTARALLRLWERSEAVGEEVLPRAQRKALALLEVTGGLTTGELSERLGVEPSSVSRLCARLEAAGHLERLERSEGRRRGAFVLTSMGRGALEEVRSMRLEALADGLDSLPGQQAHLLDAGLRGLCEVLGARLA